MTVMKGAILMKGPQNRGKPFAGLTKPEFGERECDTRGKLNRIQHISEDQFSQLQNEKSNNELREKVRRCGYKIASAISLFLTPELLMNGRPTCG
ncbi:hypothetical protein STEG23_020372, partial [Scotinomys teguina]